MKQKNLKGYLAGLIISILIFSISLYQVISHYAGAKQAELRV